MIDRVLAFVAILLLHFYRAFVSRWTGRTCQFEPSCSGHAIERFLAEGFRAGLRSTRLRLRDCCGSYSLRLSGDGTIEMVAPSGNTYREHELAPMVVAKIPRRNAGQNLSAPLGADFP
jgi:putative component of membrane protein insertase Oxa1/YidC/SpoIIIJ protein YidD